MFACVFCLFFAMMPKAMQGCLDVFGIISIKSMSSSVYICCRFNQVSVIQCHCKQGVVVSHGSLCSLGRSDEPQGAHGGNQRLALHLCHAGCTSPVDGGGTPRGSTWRVLQDQVHREGRRQRHGLLWASTVFVRASLLLWRMQWADPCFQPKKGWQVRCGFHMGGLDKVREARIGFRETVTLRCKDDTEV